MPCKTDVAVAHTIGIESETLPSKGRIQMRETNYLQINISGLQRTAGPYRCANIGSVTGA